MVFAAVLLFSTSHCPHDEPACLTPTELVEVKDEAALRAEIARPGSQKEGAHERRSEERL